jgi:L,D-peptidoglycan transpeptidase YkuD (ErfK/YbiS/YcfS/YnhG family)
MPNRRIVLRIIALIAAFCAALFSFTSSVFAYPPDSAAVTKATPDERTIARLDAIADGADRVITAVPSGKTDAIVRAYLKTGDTWSLKFETAGFFGWNGLSADRREGDGTTPKGVFTFGRAFGIADDPGSTLPYTKVTDNDVWVDDPASSYYNQWAYEDSPSRDWKSAERLIEYTVEYKYVVSINFNTAPVTPGLGSAIFLHCSTGRPTAGCVSVPEPAMIFFLGFIDEQTKIAIGDY